MKLWRLGDRQEPLWLWPTGKHSGGGSECVGGPWQSFWCPFCSVTPLGACELFSWLNSDKLRCVWVCTKQVWLFRTHKDSVSYKILIQTPYLLRLPRMDCHFQRNTGIYTTSSGSKLLVFLLYYSFFSRRKYIVKWIWWVTYILFVRLSKVDFRSEWGHFVTTKFLKFSPLEDLN